MNQKNNKFFWIMCLVTAIGAVCWSAIFVMQQAHRMFVAFLIINIVCLLVNVGCLIFDIRKNKIKK